MQDPKSFEGHFGLYRPRSDHTSSGKEGESAHEDCVLLLLELEGLIVAPILCELVPLDTAGWQLKTSSHVHAAVLLG